jgi:hypothetical protein
MAVYYLALEPFLRRTRPEVLVSWTRLLAGRVTDPLVGRDVFLGVLFGALHAVLFLGFSAAPYFISVRGLTPNFAPAPVESMPTFLGEALHSGSDALINSMGALSVMFLLGKITQKKWVVAAAICLLWATLNIGGYNYALEIPFALLAGIVIAYVIGRLGMLAVTLLFFTNTALLSVPFTLDFSRWYVGRGVLTLLVLLSFAFYGMRVSLGSRRILAQEEA